MAPKHQLVDVAILLNALADLGVTEVQIADVRQELATMTLEAVLSAIACGKSEIEWGMLCSSFQRGGTNVVSGLTPPVIKALPLVNLVEHTSIKAGVPGVNSNTSLLQRLFLVTGILTTRNRGAEHDTSVGQFIPKLTHALGHAITDLTQVRVDHGKAGRKMKMLLKAHRAENLRVVLTAETVGKDAWNHPKFPAPVGAQRGPLPSSATPHSPGSAPIDPTALDALIKCEPDVSDLLHPSDTTAAPTEHVPGSVKAEDVDTDVFGEAAGRGRVSLSAGADTRQSTASTSQTRVSSKRKADVLDATRAPKMRRLNDGATSSKPAPSASRTLASHVLVASSHIKKEIGAAAEHRTAANGPVQALDAADVTHAKAKLEHTAYTSEKAMLQPIVPSARRSAAATAKASRTARSFPLEPAPSTAASSSTYAAENSSIVKAEA